MNRRLAEPFPYRWRQPLSKLLVGADALEFLDRAAEMCARDYLDLVDNLIQVGPTLARWFAYVASAQSTNSRRRA